MGNILMRVESDKTAFSLVHLRFIYKYEHLDIIFIEDTLWILQIGQDNLQNLVFIELVVYVQSHVS